MRVVLAGVLLAGCAGTGDDAASAPPTTSATTVEVDPDESSADESSAPPTDGSSDDATDGTGDGSGDGAGDTPDDVGDDVAAAVAALGEARERWAGNDGLLYVWAYREEGEGMVLDFCVEGVVGGTASDAAACPFEGTPGGRSVESWFDTIESVLADSATTGRIADVVYDESDGHPLEIAISGGEIDSLLVTSLGVELVGEVDALPFEDLDVLASACADGDAVACYDLGAAGEPLPAALVTGNELTQAPDLDVLDRCGAGEPAACHEAGARGISGD